MQICCESYSVLVRRSTEAAMLRGCSNSAEADDGSGARRYVGLSLSRRKQREKECKSQLATDRIEN
jgi:hypothetical protein